MVWRKNPEPSQIYVLAGSGEWRNYKDPKGPPLPSCPEGEQHADLGPIYSFGLIWCEGEWKSLGRPLANEMAFENSPVEQFAGGLAFSLEQTEYILLKAGQWVSSPPTLFPPSTPNLDWVIIPGGSFVLGSSQADIQAAVADCNAYQGNCQAGWFSTESSQRQETLGDFEITRSEITNAQYNLCVENGPCSPPRKESSDKSVAYNPDFFRDDYPVVTVTAADAEIFCQWVGGRLPDEQEWEKAARGSDGRRYPWGNTLDMTLANLYSSGPARVGSYPGGASPYGVLDMAGNVAEFTTGRVVRGGSWKNYPHHGRAAHHSTGAWLSDDFANFDIGFRCVRPAVTAVEPESPLACQTNPAPEFQSLWDSHQTELGCATGPPTAIASLVEEAFEGGRLFWRRDTDEVYAIYDRQRDGTALSEGRWEKPPQKWDGLSDCEGRHVPPPGYLKPERGFGWLWCTHLDGPAGPLGWALNPETPVSGLVQPFQRGLAFKSSDRKVYALLDDGRFLARQLDAEQPAVACSPTPFQPADVFKPLWQSLGGENGPLCYPTGSAVAGRNYARQPFERGFMFWWEAPTRPQPVWVIEWSNALALSGNAWSEYQDEWNGQWEYPPNCPEAAPPKGPKRGFGLIWCSTPGVKAQLGLALKEEAGSANVNPKGAVQYFQGGLMFENPAEREVWALIYGNGWYRLGY